MTREKEGGKKEREEDAKEQERTEKIKMLIIVLLYT